jgi:spermidine synthase
VLILAAAATGGFLSLGFELALTRQFILTVTGGSVFGFASVLASFLAGIGLGAALVRMAPPRGIPSAWRRCAVALVVVWGSAMTTAWWDHVPVLLLPLWLKPLSFSARWVLDGACMTLLTITLTTAFGYLLPALAAAMEGGGEAAAVGPLFSANTLGAVAGSLVTGFVLLPGQGLSATILWLGTAALVAGLVAALLADVPNRRWRWLPMGLLAGLPLLLPVPDPVVMNLGIWNRPILFDPRERGSYFPLLLRGAARGEIVFQRDSYTGRIAVWRMLRPGGPALLSFIVNGKPDGSNGPSDMFTQVGSVHLAALAHPHPRRALVIGLGTGISAGSLARYAEVESIDIAEHEPAQVEVAHWFGEENAHVLADPRVRVILDDARQVLAQQGAPYDLIFSEPSNLFVSGMVSLYTNGFYRLVRARLAPGGVFLQWLHYYQMRPEDVRGAMRTFLSVFPEATFWINPFGDAFLLARDGGVRIDVGDWQRRAARPAVAADLARLRLSGPLDLLGFFLWGPGDLDRFAGVAPICTDDRPYLEYTTPRNRYSRDSTVARVAMQQFGPVDPMPLAGESAALRLRLARLFAERHSDARAGAERARAELLTR